MQDVKKVIGYGVLGISILICGVWAVCTWNREEGFVLEHEEEREEAEEKTEAMDSYSEAGNQTGEAGSDRVQPVEEGQQIYVYVCGEVKEPGVYSFCEGARIQQAIEAAGGFTEQAAENYLNLAGWIADGQQIYVPGKEEVTDRPAAESENSESAGTFRININKAGVTELSTLTGIGEQRAKDIISYREKNGDFTCIEDIMKVSGIKESTFERIKDRICVG